MAIGKGVDYRAEVAAARADLEKRSFTIELDREVPAEHDIIIFEKVGMNGDRHVYKAAFFDPKICWL